MNKWILVANKGNAIIFNHKKNYLKKVQSFHNEEAFKKFSDIYSDRSGSSQTSNTSNATSVSESHYKEEANQRFANEIMDFLEKQGNQNQFDELVLISDKGFIGNLRKKVTTPLKNKIKQEVLKNYYSDDPNVLLKTLKKIEME
jgi:protein required for attachment to host cells